MPPAWVAKNLGDILGLDDETINAVIVPDLEGYASEVRLRGHLQDFLGASPAARSFADKYVAYRFPSLASSSEPKSKPSSRPSSAKPKPVTAPAAAPAPPTPGKDIHDAISSALHGGTFYQKQRDDDLFSSRPNSGRGGPRSGAHTPRTGTHTPRVGAVTITEKKAKSKGKEKEADRIWDEPVLPKSTETLRLEGIVEALKNLQAGEGKVVHDGVPCFCQAREHGLSRYTPQCAACGLILCELHPAHAPCPSCARPTLTPPALARLLLRVEADIAAQLAIEAEKREQRAREKRERALAESGGGAFPSLPAHDAPQTAADAARRVLTLSAAKGKGRGKAVLTTTTTVRKDKEPSASAAEEESVQVVPRPRSPPLDPQRTVSELLKTLQWRVAEDRPWGDLKAVKRGDALHYIPPAVVAVPNEEGTGRRRKAKDKSKGLGVDGRVVVGSR